jgi:hypothetical protein
MSVEDKIFILKGNYNIYFIFLIIILGCYDSINVNQMIPKIKIPMIIIHSTQNILVNITHVSHFMKYNPKKKISLLKRIN